MYNHISGTTNIGQLAGACVLPEKTFTDATALVVCENNYIKVITDDGLRMQCVPINNAVDATPTGICYDGKGNLIDLADPVT